MERAAQQATAQGRATAELAAANAKIAELQRKLAPPQTMASGVVSGDGTGDDQYIKASNEGRVPFDAAKLQAAMRRLGYGS
jgi:hypothetical protein